MKRGQFSRADLLNALIKDDQQVQTLIADALNLHHEKPSLQKELISTTAATLKVSPKPEKQTLNTSPTSKLTAQYWKLLKQSNLKTEESKTKKTTLSNQPVIWENRPEVPDYPYLSSIEDMRNRLFSRLNHLAKGKQQLDIKAIIKTLSTGELLKRLPKKQQQQHLQALHLIDDRQVYLTPYWADHTWLTQQLYNEFADYQISRAVLQSGAQQPTLISDNAELHDYQLPPCNTPVLILSDIARLSPRASGRVKTFNQRQQAYWEFLQQLLANGSDIIIVSPCHPADYPLALRQQIHFIAWEPHTSALAPPQEGEENSTEQGLKQLLALISPVIRLEPALLRSLRRGLKQFDTQLPTAIEALLWQRPEIKQAHNIAATLSPQNLESFTDLDYPQQAFALHTIQQWRANLPPEIWFEEILNIENKLSIDKVFSGKAHAHFLQDIDSACDFLEQIVSQKKLLNANSDDYQAWLLRLEQRISGRAVQKGKASRQLLTMFHQLNPSSHTSPSGHEIDPDMMANTGLSSHKASLCQWGNQLVLTAYTPHDAPEQNTSFIATIEFALPVLKVIKENGSSSSFTLPLDFNKGIAPIAGTQNLIIDKALQLKTDQSVLTLKAEKKPQWASLIGRDSYGLYADLTIKNKQDQTVAQRFRWIPAGDFMMGSPSTEKERYEDEDYHAVQLSQGYWLADTTVTQNFWEAVMGENPASFKGKNNPVEQVSWDDTQTFIEKLSTLLTNSFGGLTLGLPTEAQWEYACRAGTQTPFSFGENITTEHVNYNGDYPYADAKKGKNRRKTVAVKSLAINPWGLYEMHGNVWEWCADTWQEQLGEQSVIDPYQYEQGVTERVVRGGSWSHNGGSVRSACRGRTSAGHRFNFIGFRLSLGLVS